VQLPRIGGDTTNKQIRKKKQHNKKFLKIKREEKKRKEITATTMPITKTTTPAKYQ